MGWIFASVLCRGTPKIIGIEIWSVTLGCWLPAMPALYNLTGTLSCPFPYYACWLSLCRSPSLLYFLDVLIGLTHSLGD